MQDFPSNSRKAARTQEPGPDERPKIEPITKGEAIPRKPKLGSRFKHAFIGGSAREAFGYQISEVVVPMIQDMLIQAIQGGIERTIRGETRVRRTPSSYSTSTHVAYNRVSNPAPSTPNSTRTLSRQARARHDFNDIVIASRAEANEVIEQMYEVLSRYGSVAVGTLYELTGITPSHADYKWGWTSLAGAKAVGLREGNFLLNLPEPQPFQQ